MGDDRMRAWAPGRPAALVSALFAAGGCSAILGLDWTPAGGAGGSGGGAGDIGIHGPSVGGSTSSSTGPRGAESASASSVDAASSSSASSVDAASSSSASSGGGGCASAGECPGADSECHFRTCEDGACGEADAPPRAPCSEGVCDGSGQCVECVVDDDCGKKGQCAARICHHCKDDVADGLETDVDCGGPVCPPCGQHETCLEDGDCKSNVCKGGTCERSTEGD